MPSQECSTPQAQRKIFVTYSLPHRQLLSSRLHAVLTGSCNVRFGIPTCCADYLRHSFLRLCLLSPYLQPRYEAQMLLGIPRSFCKRISTAQSVQQSSHSRCSHSAGCAVLSFDPYQLPAIQPVPLLLGSPADLDSPLDSTIPELGESYDTGFKGAAYLMVHAGQLWSIQYKYVPISADLALWY